MNYVVFDGDILAINKRERGALYDSGDSGEGGGARKCHL
jgi:hypothetical protein